MTLFGRTLDGQEIAALVSMLAVLALWAFAWRGERDWGRWFRSWEAARKARRDAEIATQRDDDPPSNTPKGPWS
ncbi:hypothetical protein [Brevundimonas sp.]|uniref:hypothetical protein n=1 Tax=Brevundimonas sp. TaxID=1871086 RepID=UPI003568FBA0